jgi:hypothetical protein
MNKAAQALTRKRWQDIPRVLRPMFVPRNGGCPRYKAHGFVNDRCPCGFTR